MRHWIPAPLLLLCLVAAPAVAADSTRVELTPSIGFFFDGNFDDGFDDDFLDDTEVDEGEGLGLDLGFFVNRQFQVFFSYSQQETELQFDRFLIPGPADEVSIDVEYLHVGVSYQWPLGQVQPFVFGSLGGTRLSPEEPGFDDETRFSGAFGGGVKVYFGDHFGLRLQGRLLGTFIDEEEEVFCNRRRCYTYDDSTYLFQAELNAGLIFAF